MKASGVGAEVDLERLPTSAQLDRICKSEGWNRVELATSAGEDYELLLTAPEEIVEEVDFPLYPIGRIVEGGELRWLHNGTPEELQIKGFTHF